MYSRGVAPFDELKPFAPENDPVPPETLPPAIRIGTVHVNHGQGQDFSRWSGSAEEKSERIERIANLLRDADLDVVVLTGVDFRSTWSGETNQAEEIAEAAGYPFRVEQRNFDLWFVYGCWQYGNAVLSRFPITEQEILDFPAHSQWQANMAGKYRGLACTVQMLPGKSFYVVAVHLDPRSEMVRADSVRMIEQLRRNSSIPVIAMGNFNSTPPLYPHSEDDPHGDNAIAILDTGQGFLRHPSAQQPAPADFTAPAAHPEKVIDWIMIPATWSFFDYGVLPTKLSSHCILMATVGIPPDYEIPQLEGPTAVKGILMPAPESFAPNGEGANPENENEEFDPPLIFEEDL